MEQNEKNNNIQSKCDIYIVCRILIEQKNNKILLLYLIYFIELLYNYKKYFDSTVARARHF